MIDLKEIGELLNYKYKIAKKKSDGKLLNKWCENTKDNLEKLILLGYRLDKEISTNGKIILVMNADNEYLKDGDLHFYSNEETISNIKKEFKEIVNFF